MKQSKSAAWRVQRRERLAQRGAAGESSASVTCSTPSAYRVVIGSPLRRNTANIGVFSWSTNASNSAYSPVSRDAGEMLQQPACDSSSLPGVCDSEGYLGGAAEHRVATFADDEFFASVWHGGHQSQVVPVADVVEPAKVTFAQCLFRAKESGTNRLGLEMKKRFDKALLVIGAHGPDGHLVAVLQRFLSKMDRYIRHVSLSDTIPGS